jgi:hypothetical protein
MYEMALFYRKTVYIMGTKTITIMNNKNNILPNEGNEKRGHSGCMTGACGKCRCG